MIYPLRIGVKDGLGHHVEIFQRRFWFGIVGGGECGCGDEYGREEQGVPVALSGLGTIRHWVSIRQAWWSGTFGRGDGEGGSETRPYRQC